jgi:8-oxo-dGTP diphosphatase
MKVIEKIAVGVFKDDKVLLVRPYKHGPKFLTLGGKIEEGENDIECIKREVMEEVSSRVDEPSIKFLKEFNAPAHGREDTMLHIKYYSAILLDEPKPSSEIAEVKYFDSTIPDENETEMGHIIMKFLKEKRLIT